MRSRTLPIGLTLFEDNVGPTVRPKFNNNLGQITFYMNISIIFFRKKLSLYDLLKPMANLILILLFRKWEQI